MLSGSSSALPGEHHAGRMEKQSFLKCKKTNFRKNHPAGNRKTSPVSKEHNIKFFLPPYGIERCGFSSKKRTVCA